MNPKQRVTVIGPTRNRRLAMAMLAAAALFGAAEWVAAQTSIWTGGYNLQTPINYGLPDRQDGFTLCRLRYANVRRARKSGWGDDYPNGDYNFLQRLSELTTIKSSRWNNGNPGFSQFTAMDPDLFHCPVLRMHNAANNEFTDQEAARLRQYLLKGGFLWMDDNWDPDFEYIRPNLARILPGYQIVDLPVEYPMFSVLYRLDHLPQIPAINSWFRTGQDSEIGPSKVHYYGILDDHDRLMVLVSMNSDVSDSWEREGDNQEYFVRYSPSGYALGVDVVVWVLTH
ncbi:MAG: DUF4159 domain-containing protein [Vicinamibacterales bacterium]